VSWNGREAIGWRDLKAAPGKFGFVVLSVALSGGAGGVRGSAIASKYLSTEARIVDAGDLSARIFRFPPTTKGQARGD